MQISCLERGKSLHVSLLHIAVDPKYLILKASCKLLSFYDMLYQTLLFRSQSLHQKESLDTIQDYLQPAIHLQKKIDLDPHCRHQLL